MNTKQANALLLTDIMDSLGHKVYQTHKGGAELAYLSPFREEAKPSFYVNARKNAWYDHGLGEGTYSVVDFAIQYLASRGKTSSVSDALAWLDNLGVAPLSQSQKSLFLSESKESENEADIRNLQFIRATPIKHNAIFQYLQNRGIGSDLVSKYLLEIQYRNLKNDKVYFGFGMKNQSDGYEVRSAMDSPAFKSALIERNITIIAGEVRKEPAINVFEGMTDFLSLLALYDSSALRNDAIIMHSLSSYKNTMDYLGTMEYTQINLWLDNDISGIKMKARFEESFGDIVVDQSFRYLKYNDINDALKASLKSGDEDSLDFIF